MISFGVGIAVGAAWGGGWGWGCGWGGNDININVNNNFVRNNNIRTQHQQQQGRQQQQMAARLAATGAARRTRTRRRPTSSAERRVAIHWRRGSRVRRRSRRGVPRRIAQRLPLSAGARSTAASGGGDKVGSREVPRSSSSGGSALGGSSSGASRAQASSSRGSTAPLAAAEALGAADAGGSAAEKTMNIGLKCGLLWMASLTLAVTAAAQSAPAAQTQKTFETPQQAAAALIAAAEAFDTAALESLLGPDGRSLVVTEDAVAGQEPRQGVRRRGT